MTGDQKLVFLAEYRVSANLSFAASAANVTTGAALRERNADPSFEERWREAEKEACLAFFARRRSV